MVQLLLCGLKQINISPAKGAAIWRTLELLDGEQTVQRLSEFAQDESAASAAEYALILALVAIVIITGLTFLGQAINSTLSTDASAIASTTAS